MAQFRIDVSSGTLSYQIHTGDMSLKLEVWPYDVPKLNATGLPVFSDCRWVSGKGWYCADSFVIPTVTWGTPSVSWSANVLTMSMGTIPTYATSPEIGVVQFYGNLWTYPNFQLISGDYVNYFSASGWTNKKSGLVIRRLNANTVAATNPRGSALPSVVTVNLWQVHIVVSDYGPVSFMREINGLSVTIP